MTQQLQCPTCHSGVQPSWDWCMACGFDPGGHRPADWQPPIAPPAPAPPVAAPLVAAPRIGAPPVAGRVLVGVGGSDRGAEPARPTKVADARPQEITDPDWVAIEPKNRLSYLGVVAVVVAILIALGGLVFVIILVLHQPVGTTQADAMRALAVSPRFAAATR